MGISHLYERGCSDNVGYNTDDWFHTTYFSAAFYQFKFIKSCFEPHGEVPIVYK